MHITGIILAAGTSSRMGSVNKLLLEYRGHTIVEETLAQLSSADVDSILIVTGHDRARVEKALAAGLTPKMQLVHNPGYALGRAASIKRAIEHVCNRTDAALFMVADKPGVSTDLINRAVARFRREQPVILYVETPDGRGHPIVFAKALFGELLSLEGDRVGDDMVAKHANSCVSLKDDTAQIDIDNETDYRILLETESSRKMP
ncbi:MAG: nucleotidyltransferase family protein [Candidatus Zixiibacteriota bacterium]|nr:MAG: nucleotidyltransferase family protein [candidate division Zixibacteria bacterium]